MGKTLRYTLAEVFTFCIYMVHAQPTIQSLQEQISRAEEEIRRSNELLQQTQKNREVSQSQLKLVLSRITSRREVVNNLEKQISLLQDQISDRNRSVSELTAEIDQLKEEYAAMVREAYKNHKLNNFALFLFAAEDFNDATRRVDYMRRYNQARELRAGQLRELSDSLTAEIAELDSRRAELDNTRSTHGTALETLRRDETQYRSSVSKLQQEESKITREVRAKQEQINKAQQEIQRLIAEEARRNNAETRTAAEDRYIAELSGRFDDNKGKLPYPVRNGVIIDRFGSHPHPTQRGLTVNNTGVNIAGSSGADVICVFEGTVSMVVVIPGYNNGIVVRHGNYFTLYANLASVSVRKGDRLSLNQKLGTLASGGNPDDTFVHFEVWKNNTGGEPSRLNPEQWLHR